MEESGEAHLDVDEGRHDTRRREFNLPLSRLYLPVHGEINCETPQVLDTWYKIHLKLHIEFDFAQFIPLRLPKRRKVERSQ